MKNSKPRKDQDAKAWLLSTSMLHNKKNLLKQFSLQIYLQTLKIILVLSTKNSRNHSVSIFY